LRISCESHRSLWRRTNGKLADLLKDHVTLEVECIDRMYLNVYVPKLQFERGMDGDRQVLSVDRAGHGHDEPLLRLLRRPRLRTLLHQGLLLLPATTPRYV